MNQGARAGSATRENRAFRQAIASMRQEVLESQAETQRTKDQLNCLVLLVKRAWSGDQSATIHVANIVGVQPPTFQQEEAGRELTAFCKSKSVHHWALLTVGLLNQHYRRLEEHALTLAKRRLQQRQGFLDDQLRHHQEMLEQPQTVPLKHHEHPGIHKQGVFMTSDAHPTAGHQMTTTDTESSLAQHIYHVGKPKLFEVPPELSNKPKAKRPMSAQQLKQADTQRARPRSAVDKTAVKTERPLKYETTHPAKVKTKSGASKTETPSRNRSKVSPSSSSKPADESYTLDLNKNVSSGSQEPPKSRAPLSMEDSVTEELRKIERMESEFEETTKLLQLKLGISVSGAI